MVGLGHGIMSALQASLAGYSVAGGELGRQSCGLGEDTELSA